MDGWIGGWDYACPNCSALRTQHIIVEANPYQLVEVDAEVDVVGT